MELLNLFLICFGFFGFFAIIEVIKLKKEVRKLNGIVKHLLKNENGSIKREGRLKNGSPIGRWTYYNLDGSIKKTTDH